MSGMLGGGSSQPQQQQPTSTTVTNTNLPAWAQPYSENLLGQASALTDINQNPYQQYQGQRLADFTPMQQQAFSNVGNMQVSPQNQQATGLAGMAGLGSLGAGQQYNQMATNPGAVSAFMSPYAQAAIDPTLQENQRQFDIANTGRQAAAARSGAFGGSRQAIEQSEAQRNLGYLQSDTQAKGMQNAFQNAQQAQQFGANLGMQGYNQALQGANTLGQLGQNQYNQQTGINAAQQQVGAQQQAFNQQGLTNQYQDFLNQQNYPYQQLGFMSDILHGTPTGGITSAQTSQAAPTAFNNMMSLGLGAYGASKLMAKGGAIKGYKEGGAIKGFAGGGITGGMSLEAQFNLAKMMSPTQLKSISSGQQRSEISSAVAAAALPLAVENATASAGAQAQQELAKSPGTVIDRMMAQHQPAQLPENQGGVASLPAENMNDVAQAAEGGVMGYAGGGGVQHFQSQGQVPFQPVLPFSLRRGSEGEKQRDAQSRANEMAMNTGAPLPFPPPETSEFETPEAGGMARLRGEVEPASSLSEPPVTAAPAAAPVATPAVASPRKPTSGIESLNASPEALARMQANIDAAKAAAAPAQEPAGIAALEQAGPPAPTGFDAFQRKVTSASQGYLDEATKLLSGMTATDSEKNEAKAHATGIAFIRAAAALREMGPSGNNQAKAMEALAKGAQDYTTETKADRKAAVAAGMSLAMAKAHLAQGDTKIAAEMFNHSEKLLLDDKKLAMEHGQWTAEREDKHQLAMAQIAHLREQAGLMGAQTEQAQAEARIGIPAKSAYYRNAGAAATSGAAKIGAQETIAQRTASINSAKDILADITSPPATKKAARDYLQSVFTSGIATPLPRSVQLPETGVSAKDILE